MNGDGGVRFFQRHDIETVVFKFFQTLQESVLNRFVRRSFGHHVQKDADLKAVVFHEEIIKFVARPHRGVIEHKTHFDFFFAADSFFGRAKNFCQESIVFVGGNQIRQLVEIFICPVAETFRGNKFSFKKFKGEESIDEGSAARVQVSHVAKAIVAEF